MKDKKIYVADDEQNIREALITFLENDGFTVSAFETGDLLLEKFKEEQADLVILDVMMPGTNGFNVCSELRKTSTVPIIMLTARDSDLDYATGLSLGSDDYFTKPFSPMALVMRVNAIFRRIEFNKIEFDKNKEEVEQISFGDILIDTSSKTIEVNNENVDLKIIEYDLLCFLLKNSDKTVTREDILKTIWNLKSEVKVGIIDDTIKSLRSKLSNSNVKIETIWGHGFNVLIQK